MNIYKSIILIVSLLIATPSIAESQLPLGTYQCGKTFPIKILGNKVIVGSGDLTRTVDRSNFGNWDTSFDSFFEPDDLTKEHIKVVENQIGLTIFLDLQLAGTNYPDDPREVYEVQFGLVIATLFKKEDTYMLDYKNFLVGNSETSQGLESDDPQPVPDEASPMKSSSVIDKTMTCEFTPGLY